MWAHVEDGKVVKLFNKLPSSYKNISGFNKMSYVKLRDYGIYHVRHDSPNFNPDTHELGERTVTVGDDEVVVSFETKPVDEKILEAKRKNVHNSARQSLIETIAMTGALLADDVKAKLSSAYVTELQELRTRAISMLSSEQLDEAKAKEFGEAKEHLKRAEKTNKSEAKGKGKGKTKGES